ncbi:uncharacterized protein LOC135349103 [Halichondria panicea]|uniref:uncharacterized protein LOC135349103 n=1 Tax=Halichondria panicea TaxID=6063 RepID=UPI00312B759C
MSEKEILSRVDNNIPLEGGQAFPPASHQEVGVGSAQRENRGEGDQPEPSPNIIQEPHILPPDSTHSTPYFFDQKNIEGDDELDSEKYPLPASENAEPVLSRLVTGSSFGLSSDCRECTQAEPMMFVPSVGNKVFQRKLCLHKD